MRRPGNNIDAIAGRRHGGNSFAYSISRHQRIFRKHSSRAWSFRRYCQVSEYGKRNYAMGIGRWLSKDPVGHFGGLNEVVFNANSCVNQFDYLGLATIPGDNDIQRKRDCSARLRDVILIPDVITEITKRTNKRCFPKLMCTCCYHAEAGECSGAYNREDGSVPTDGLQIPDPLDPDKQITVNKGDTVWNVIVCYNMTKQYTESIEHEIQHYLDKCDGFDPKIPADGPGWCYSLLCGEMRASRRENLCQDTPSCAAYVVGVNTWWDDYGCGDISYYPPDTKDMRRYMRELLLKCDVSKIAPWESSSGGSR